MRCPGGFTLVELLVTIALLAALLVIGVPSFMELMSNNRLTSATNDLVTALTYARGEAVRRGVRVSVCASTNGTTCLTASGPWERGWLVFAETDTAAGAAEGTFDTNDTLLRVHQGVGGSVTVTETGGATSVTFRPDGAVNAARTFDICDAGRTGETGRRVAVGLAGRPGVDDLACP